MYYSKCKLDKHTSLEKLLKLRKFITLFQSALTMWFVFMFSNMYIYGIVNRFRSSIQIISFLSCDFNLMWVVSYQYVLKKMSFRYCWTSNCLVIIINKDFGLKYMLGTNMHIFKIWIWWNCSIRLWFYEYI